MSNVDLSALRIDDSQAAIPKRPIGPRLLVLALLALAVAVAATFLVPILWPARAVRMVAVQPASQASSTAAIGGTEAVGWVEADPYGVTVRPLVSGHIESLEVLEGAQVKAGETVIARLASAELLAAVERTKAAVLEHDADHAAAGAKQVLATERLKQNADATLRSQEAETKLATIRTKVDTAKERLRQVAAESESAAAHVKAQQRLQEAGNSFPVALERARADAEAAQAAVAASQAELNGLQNEHGEQRSLLELCEQFAADPVELRGAVAISDAELAKAKAALATARIELQIAERELDWAIVRAPVNGVVLRLEAEPGDMVGHGEKGIVVLYDPKKLRARIDVPIDSLSGIREGQAVEVTSDAIGSLVVKGVVQRFQHETDMLKNTLQVKIGLVDPPAMLRPETLCRARFLAPTTSEQSGTPKMVTAWRVPKTAVNDGRVYLFDPKNGTAREVAVEVLGEDGDATIVRGDLSPTHRVVIEPVSNGEAIQEATQ
ncbi:MAG: HlyD family secretion protein [Planctomycetota bacterium]|jgi:HlyD family secretion protein